MGQTMVEQIFSRKSGRSVCPGELLNISVDAVMIHDFNAPHVLGVLQQVEKELGEGNFSIQKEIHPKSWE